MRLAEHEAMPSVDEGAYVVHFRMEQVEQARERLGRRVQNEARRTTSRSVLDAVRICKVFVILKPNELFSASRVLE